MKLCIDIGNTNTCVGLYKDHLQKFFSRHETHVSQNEWNNIFKKIGEKHQPASLVMGSVVPELNQDIQESAKNIWPAIQVQQITFKEIPLQFEVDDPSKVGVDRLINAFAAHKRYQTDLIVVDLGTATKFDVVRADGTFMGGVICPGLRISEQALYQRASQLSEVPLEKPFNLIGRNTTECLQSGFYYGYSGLIDHMVERIRKTLRKEATVVATGGLSPLLAEAITTLDHHDEDLTLFGLDQLK